MQVPSDIASDTEPDRPNDMLDAALIADQRGLRAWHAFLRAHASLMRSLAADLADQTGLTLGDFDVLAQLSLGGGELRMTDLATRAYSSRSGMTRRVDRLVTEGLVVRSGSGTDARSVVVALSDAGRARLAETFPIHLEEVVRLFVDPLDDEELLAVERAMRKVAVDCSFG
jgi:DNA-binding MarR family transcriptional regulator